jgi:ureidoacrylate peracid hydrolase
MQHPSGIAEKIVRKVVARRGRLHAFETIDPKSTALVVIDLDAATVGHDDTWPSIIATVNALAAAVRESGGVVAWVLSRMNAMPKHFSAILGVELASAFFPGKCNLKAQLDARGIDTVLIAGSATNVCCESSARDAAELEYKVIMVSDALSGHAHGLHEATLATFYRIFGDVRPSDEVIRLLR